MPALIRIILILTCLTAYAADVAGAPFQPMLAQSWDPALDPQGWWMSEKFDGIRGLWDGEQMWSRKGTPITLADELRRELPPFALDGELWAGHGRFALVQSTVLDQDVGNAWSEISYRIFDVPQEPGPFEQRMQRLYHWLEQHPAPRLQPVVQQHCRGREHLLAYLQQIETQGGEGVMLRRPGSAYSSGRSDSLLKVKSFEDAEAVVVGYTPGKGRLAGMVGSLILELPDGTRFAAGSGLDDAERQHPPAIGTQVTFKYFGWTSHGKPRFPVYWRVRK